MTAKGPTPQYLYLVRTGHGLAAHRIATYRTRAAAQIHASKLAHSSIWQIRATVADLALVRD